MGKKKAKEPEAPPKEEFDAVELITKRPQTVVLVLQSQEVVVLQTVCEALYKFAEKSSENILQLVNFGALEYLIKLVSHEDKLVRRNAAMCLGTVASEVTARRVLRKFGCIPPLLMLLAPDEEVVCHEFGTLALSYLAEDYTSKVEIFEKQGLPLLINHLTSLDCDVQHNSVRAIGLLLEDFRCRAVFEKLNGIEPLLKLLDSEYPVIQSLSLAALVICSQDAENRSAIRELDGLSKFVDIIGRESMTDLHIPCLKCLANCLEDTDSLKQIQSTGVFQKLLVFVAESSSPEMQQFSASVIAVACKKDENRRIFNEQETEKTLITLLGSDNVSVVIAATKALAAMAENLTSRDKIGRLDGIPPIIQLSKNENTEAKQVASLALANLTNSNAFNGAIVMEKNATDILIKLLSDSNGGTQSNAAACFSNLSSNESWRTAIVKQGVIKGLVAAIKTDDSRVQVYGCQALASYLCDYDSRFQLLTEGGITQLITLIKSNDAHVRKNASWVIVLCAVDRELAEEVTRCGGLEVLQEINLSSRCSKFTEAALERLLDCNLPAKYALTGMLKFDNIIGDVFYDTGRINPGGTISTLEDLKKQPINQNRPILLVSFKRHSLPTYSQEAEVEPQLQQTKVEKVEKNRSKSKQHGRRQSKTKNTYKEREEIAEQLPDETNPQVNESLNEYELQVDETFLSYIAEIQSTIAPIISMEKQIRELSSYVCEKMGGSIEKADIKRFSYELHISELKRECESNIIPIGKVEKGIYYHRALLYKVFCDNLSIPCTLVRGNYGRAWNEVQICDVNDNGQILLPPKLFIVDLMHRPGELMTSGSPEAVSYERI